MQAIRNSLYALILAKVALLIVLGAFPAGSDAASCQGDRVKVQMLGTRGPEFLDDRASTGYLLWLDDKARIIVDAGPGSLQRFKQSKARFEDVGVLLFTHFHVDHSADFPAYIKASFFTDRDRRLYVYGPSGTAFVASAEQFVERMIGSDAGTYPYLGNYLDPAASSSYKIEVHTLPWSLEDVGVRPVHESADYKITAVPVHHGPFPAFGYRIEVAGCVISVTGDMSGRLRAMPGLARGSDILVAHNAIPEDATGVPALLHMTPSYIGEMAAEAEVRKLVLSHLMERTVGRQEETLGLIRRSYDGPVLFPKDLEVIRP
jgi:ribonuclease BN (tRNA processing enzyme)